MKKVFAAGCGVLLLVGLLVAAVVVIWGLGSYNQLVALDEQVDASWSQVENVYQRRADLIPNLINTVQGAADFEKETLTAVIEARAQATSVQVAPGQLSDPQALARFEQAQSGLGSALGRLMVVVERYPDIKANQNFVQLQDELAGTENRIAVERKRFNESARAFNTARRSFPTVVIAGWFGFEEKAYFQATPGADQPPVVDFDK